jgi:hypothetical protein
MVWMSARFSFIKTWLAFPCGRFHPFRFSMRSFFLSLLLALPLYAETAPDPALLEEINKIRAIDNHAHPLGSLNEGEKDDEFEVADSIPARVLPVRLRPDNPEYIGAWRALYGYRGEGKTEADAEELLKAKAHRRQEKGLAYPAWVLDQLGIETMLANRMVMGRGLDAPRFRWVWHANPFLFPLNNDEGKKSNPQRQADFTTDEGYLKRYLAEAGLASLPDTLDEYLTKLVIPIIEKRKAKGAIAAKFYAAYMRSLDFADVPEAEAAPIYARYIHGGAPGAVEYKALQDFLFRRIALECGRVGFSVHIHVGAGAGGWFYNRDASPFLLDSVLNDPALRGTKFVLIHGGLPFAQATRMLIGRPNVYADFSSQAFLTSTRELSHVIRSWLEAFPEKVLFGTDSYPETKTVGWEEIAWLTTKSGREALALALTEMIQDGEISRTRATELAHMVLRGNALDLYGSLLQPAAPAPSQH